MENPLKMDDLGVPLFSETSTPFLKPSRGIKPKNPQFSGGWLVGNTQMRHLSLHVFTCA